MSCGSRRIALVAFMSLALRSFAQELPERPYPEGNAFPLGAYSLQPAEEMPGVTPFGWNFGHSYQFDAAYLDATLANGLYSLASLPRVEEDVTRETVRERISECAAHENVLWWDLPEDATEAIALFETVTPEDEEDAEPIQRSVPITAGSLEDRFGRPGVHIYRIALPEA